MEWLKEILEQAAAREGGMDVNTVMAKISAEFPKHAVPKKDYNGKVEELKTANATIDTLKQENKGNTDLQAKIADYETQITTLKKTAENTRREYVLKEKLAAAGALDAEYIIFKQGGVEKFSFDAEGKPTGIDEIIKPLKEESPHLFKAAPGADYKPSGGSNTQDVNPWAKDSFNLTEQGRIYKENPAMAQQLASAAGTTI